MTGAARNTITTLLVDLGKACAAIRTEAARPDLARRIECDEIWSFCYAKARTSPRTQRGEFGYGDVWTWTAIDADTKLVPSWLVGERDQVEARVFITDLRARLADRVQLTTDGHVYLAAIEPTFGQDVDYAHADQGLRRRRQDERLAYSPPLLAARSPARRSASSPATPTRSSSRPVYVERQNLTMRMGMRRFTRLTNGFSKKVENQARDVSLHFMHYNFARPHTSRSQAHRPRRWLRASPITSGPAGMYCGVV